jgi:hypothetical protein
MGGAGGPVPGTGQDVFWDIELFYTKTLKQMNSGG